VVRDGRRLKSRTFNDFYISSFVASGLLSGRLTTTGHSIVRLASLLLGTGVCLSLAGPTAVAQSRMSTELFVARNSALAPGSSLYGLGLTFGGGPIGLRASGAAAFRTRSTAQGESIDVDAWTGEVDLLIQPGLLGAVGAVLPISPYVFGGLGQLSSTDFDGFRQRWTGVSYGGGAAVPLARSLGVTAEGRYRLPLSEALTENSSVQSSFPRGWEYRFGLSISLGG
jgi:hypothetical protein